MDVLDVARFWSKVNVGNHTDCWEWQGGTWHTGYGAVKVGGRDGKCLSAHRVAMEMATGEPLSSDVIVRHKCDNPRCVNPLHLTTGTHADNVRDRVIRKRGAIGEKAGRAKLTEAQAQDILDSVDHPMKAARRHGVSVYTVESIRKRRGWRHLKPSATLRNETPATP